MKFIHAADIHLDSPLRGLQQYPGAPAAELRSATRHALRNLTRLCLEERVDFLLIAGDVYDGDWTDISTGLFFASQMSLLREAAIRVFIIRGNHDAASQITSRLTLPQNVFEFPTKEPDTVVIEELGVAVHGQSFPTRAVTTDLVARYPLAIGGCFNIGLLHTSADGREGHEPYAPCTISGMRSRGYDYWALGHVHQREVLCQDPWIVFPGNLQGRHARERGVKGCTLITTVDHQIASVEHRALDVARWCECVVDADGADDLDKLLDRTRRALMLESEVAEERLLAVRLVVEGICGAHRQLVADHEQFTNECRAVASDVGCGRIWIEGTRLHTRTPLDLDELAKHDDPLGDLVRFTRALPGDQVSMSELVAQFKPLQHKLPLELRRGDDDITLDDPSAIAALLPEVEQFLLSRLMEMEDFR